jgi:hypothetical protein
MSAERAIAPRFSIDNLSLELSSLELSGHVSGTGKVRGDAWRKCVPAVKCEWNDSFPGALRSLERVNRRATDPEERTR